MNLCKQYNIEAKTEADITNSLNNTDKDKNISYTGLCTIGQAITSEWVVALGTYYIWTDFTDINISSFKDSVEICGYNMNTDVEEGLIEMINKYNSIFPATIITDIPSSRFNNKNILVLSTSDLKPASEPNKFNINLIVY